MAPVEMDERLEHFLISVGDMCAAAALARLDIEVVTGGRMRVRGVPSSPRPVDGDDEVGDSGFARTFRIADHLIAFEDIVSCTIHSPNPPSGREDGVVER
jgi:hypothetical protein